MVLAARWTLIGCHKNLTSGVLQSKVMNPVTIVGHLMGMSGPAEVFTVLYSGPRRIRWALTLSLGD